MTQIFCVQDRTGTSAQLTLDMHGSFPISIGDTGSYSGTVLHGADDVQVSMAFTVGQVLDPLNFGVFTRDVTQSGWPDNGFITWNTGLNANDTDVIVQMAPANAYITTDFLAQYVESRGTFVYPDSPIEPVRQAIVQATDYLDQRYRFKGIKLLQFVSGSPNFENQIAAIDPWLSPFGYTQVAFFTPSTTSQMTEWPRQGVVDASGDTVYGTPQKIQFACAELALRALNGITLQPDYDPNYAMQGAVLTSISEEIGPLKVSKTYDSKFGLGFFPDFPHVTKILRHAGLLVAGGGRSLIR